MNNHCDLLWLGAAGAGQACPPHVRRHFEYYYAFAWCTVVRTAESGVLRTIITITNGGHDIFSLLLSGCTKYQRAGYCLTFMCYPPLIINYDMVMQKWIIWNVFYCSPKNNVSDSVILYSSFSRKPPVFSKYAVVLSVILY